ncbi:Peptide methionine sulfoxide reductase MsrB [Methyloligella halotolerans]|uniref:Peptide methionine sulfoxide reductase MsrB n=1 Tax=Methyloligella halotolerans TaxID=1177755 RepID=A0A1E2RXQ0_9HYPH|nr:peptide-methionine (R)-S-oxide reductase MsrB [Methyloligella halotolerans]ODA66878.1 Peptide methionine sulfoxide reductase MsrB [Methyloligella halotolerans]
MFLAHNSWDTSHAENRQREGWLARQAESGGYHVTQEQGTEPAFSHAYYEEKRDGMYHCVCCDAPLFSSDAKFESGTGWPSFTDPAVAANVTTHEDISHGMRRVEVRCANCDAHLGHVFPDGPGPEGLRYCINGCALDFDPA